MAQIAQMFQDANAIMSNYVASGYQAVAQELAAPYWSAFTLAMIFFGFRFLQQGRGTFLDLALLGLKGLVISEIALNWGNFTDFAYGSLLALQDRVGSVLFGLGSYGGPAHGTSASISNGTAIEAAFNRILMGFTALWQKGDLTNLGPYAEAIMILLAGLLVLGYGAFILLFANVGTALTVVLGPLFICTALFGATRGFFWGWVRSVMGFILTPMLVAAVVAFALAVMDADINAAMTGAILIQDAAMTLFMGICMWFSIRQVPQIAGGLAGASASSGAGALAEMFVSPIARTALGVGPIARDLYRDYRAQRGGALYERGRWNEMKARREAAAAGRRRSSGP
jgi:type IV secretion system protein VirB6